MGETVTVKVCFFPSDYSGAGCYRCLFPGRELKNQFGHETFVPETVHDGKGNYAYQLKTIPNADLYVLQQRPEVEWLQIIPFLKDRGKKIVCETDDYYHGIPHWHPAYGPTRPLVKNLHEVYRLADCMTVSTPFLKEVYAEYNENIHVLPNYLDREMWEDLPEKDWDNVRVGWMGVSMMRPADLHVLRGIIGPFLSRHPEVDFVAAGDSAVHDLLGVPDAQRVSYARVEFGGTPGITATMDVGLVPLTDAKFNEAKSHLKGMEYAACGIPCVASSTGPYRQWVEEGVNGFLAKRPHDWVRHLEALVGDSALRERMGCAARAKAERNFIQDHAHKWNELYERLAGDEFDQVARDAVTRAALQKPNELAPFLRYVARHKPKTVVEIGTAQGGMLYALAQVAAADALIVSIDLPGGDLDDTSEDDKYGSRDTDKMAAYIKSQQRVEFLQMDSHHPGTRATLERILAGREIDLLFIDGDHSYEGVKADFEQYRDMVRPGGLVAFHDIISHTAEGAEVDRFWDEIKGGYSHKEFLSPEDFGWGPWGGIGVLEMEEFLVEAA